MLWLHWYRLNSFTVLAKPIGRCVRFKRISASSADWLTFHMYPHGVTITALRIENPSICQQSLGAMSTAWRLRSASLSVKTRKTNQYSNAALAPYPRVDRGKKSFGDSFRDPARRILAGPNGFEPSALTLTRSCSAVEL